MWKSSFEKIVGNASDDTKEKIMQHFDGVFDNQKIFNELLADGEVEKTMDEIKIISLSNKITNDLRKKYDLPEFNIPLKNVHIIDEKKWFNTNLPLRDSSIGMYYSLQQGIAVMENKSNLATFNRVLHEMIHFKSYNTLQILELKENIKTKVQKYRVGLTMLSRKDDKKSYFTNINEAVTEMLTMELMKKNISNPLFEKDLNKTKKISERYHDTLTENDEKFFNEDMYFADIVQEKSSENKGFPSFSLRAYGFSYKKERVILEELVKKLYEKNREKFNNTEEVLNLFKEGAMTGNMMKYGRLIDNTFGKGTLRKIGVLDSSADSQEEFIKSL